MRLRRAGNRHDPRLLRQQPRQRHLRGRHLLLRRKPADQIHQRLIRLAVLRLKRGTHVAKIRAGELRVCVDLAREESLAQRTEWHEADSEFLQRRHYFRFRLSPTQRVFAL